MEYWHHIGVSHKDNVKSQVDSLHINYKLTPSIGDGYLLTFDIAESDSRWLQVEEIIRAVHALNMTETFFSDDEIRMADWSRLIPSYESGYPQPQSTWSRAPNNYREWCPECGAGFKQIAPFKIRREPNMKHTDFMSLYWAYALFGTQKVFELFESAGIRGYKMGEVLLNKTSTPSSVVKQVCVNGVTSQGLLDTQHLDSKICLNCGVTKYKYHKRGYMHYLGNALPVDTDIVMTYEWFGDGGAAFREFLISNKLTILILDHKLKGVTLKPIATE